MYLGCSLSSSGVRTRGRLGRLGFVGIEEGGGRQIRPNPPVAGLSFWNKVAVSLLTVLFTLGLLLVLTPAIGKDAYFQRHTYKTEHPVFSLCSFSFQFPRSLWLDIWHTMTWRLPFTHSWGCMLLSIGLKEKKSAGSFSVVFFVAWPYRPNTRRFFQYLSVASESYGSVDRKG